MALDKKLQVQRLIVLGVMAQLEIDEQQAIRQMKQEILSFLEKVETPKHGALALALAGFDYADKHEG